MPSPAAHARILTVAVGNTRARWAWFAGREFDPGDAAPVGQAEAPLRALMESRTPQAVVISSVNAPAADAIESALAVHGAPIHRLGRDFAPPLTHTLEDASTLGMDRACCALAAYDLAQSAVAVIDAGTAITVDFVDGEGVFHGGAIAPGVRMMLQSLHEHTAALPDLDYDPHAQGPFGRDTAHAMQLGVAAAARGLVRDLVERFADHYDAYPRVLATGGDAPALFEGDGLVERIIPDLQLIGIQRAFEAAAEHEA
jgi:type III pantothenate kinase